MPETDASPSRFSTSRLVVFTVSFLSYLTYTFLASRLPVDPSAATWKDFLSACFVPLLLLVLFTFRKPRRVWENLSRFENASVEIKVFVLLIIPSILMAGTSEWLQYTYLGFSVKLNYVFVGPVGFQYLYFPIVTFVSFCFTLLFLISFPINRAAKKVVSLRNHPRTYYALLDTTMFFLLFLTGISDFSKLSGIETAPSNTFVIPFTLTMWIEYLTLNLTLLPFFVLARYFLYQKPSRITLTRSLTSWVTYLLALAYFVISEGSRFGLSQIWIFGSICAYWGIAVSANLVAPRI